MNKYSRKREAILRTIMNTDTHPTAAWIYEQLKPEYPDLSLATVYRNLGEFVKEGTIVQISTVNGQERYDANVEPHTHFICDNCGSVLDIGEFEDTINDSLIGAAAGVKVLRHDLIFRGSCRECM